ncbi:MAG: restriction endonuclease PLD domain-containing protein [Thermodesulfobacteriota bacterium]
MKELESVFPSATSVRIASGYIGEDIIRKFTPEFKRITENGGICQLLHGMALYSGLTESKLSLLNELNTLLSSYSENNGVFVSYSGRYHGKLYHIETENEKKIYAGSSNFSITGLKQYKECTILIKDSKTSLMVEDYLNYLFNAKVSTSILRADIHITKKESDRLRQQKITELAELKQFDSTKIDTSKLPMFTISLDRIANAQKSNLNCYFGKGRWTRTTGLVKLRHWYEVEVIVPKAITSNPLYPKGDFTAYTHDGYLIPMKTSGDYNKNMRSRGNLRIFGMWLKSKLEDSGSLTRFTPVTRETLESYGRNSLTFYKFGRNKYYIEF